MSQPSAFDARLAEIDRRLRTIQSGLQPAAQSAAEPLAFPGPTLVPPPAAAPDPDSPSRADAADRDLPSRADAADLIAALRDLVARQERWLTAARELLAAYDGALAPVGVSAGPFASMEALRRFEGSLAALPEVRQAALREYAGDYRAVIDVHLFGPPIS